VSLATRSRRGSRVFSSRHSPLALVFRLLADAVAALGFSPLATLLSGSLATRSRRRGSRLSLGFTRSRLSGSLAVAVLTGSPPSSLSTRGDDTAPADELDLWICRSTFICFARLAPFLAAHLLRKVSPFLGFSFDFICFARIALRRPRSVLRNPGLQSFEEPRSTII
jgi:hypothetical protein